MLSVTSSFTSDRFLLEALKGKENELATKWARKLCQNQNNQFPIQLPSTLEAVKSNVTKLDLSELTLTPSILKSIALLLPNIEQLNFNKTTLDAECIKALGSFPKLKYLSLKKCRLNDEALQHLRNCTLLENLDVSNNTRLTGSFFSELPTTLKGLSCKGCTLTDQAINRLQNKTQLEILNLSGNSLLTGATFDALPTSLKELNCNNCIALTDQAIFGLQNKTQLETLDLSNNKLLTGVNFDVLPSSLNELLVSRNNLSDNAIEGLRNKVQLKKLDLSFNSLLTGVTFAALPPSLKELICNGCTALTDQIIVGLQNNTQLEILEMQISFYNNWDILPPSLKLIKSYGKVLHTEEEINRSRALAIEHKKKGKELQEAVRKSGEELRLAREKSEEGNRKYEEERRQRRIGAIELEKRRKELEEELRKAQENSRQSDLRFTNPGAYNAFQEDLSERIRMVMSRGGVSVSQ